MKRFLFLLVGLTALNGWAKDPEHFDNQSQIAVQGDGAVAECQATRITPKWYLTAAHCVVPFCDKECDIIVDVLQGEIHASAIVHHKAGDAERVFVQGDYQAGRADSIRSDIALILFDPPEHDYFFKLTRSNKELSWEEFQEVLESSAYKEQREQWNFLQTERAKLLQVTDLVSREVLPSVAVPNLTTGVPAIGSGFYYFSELRHYIGPDIGVAHGMSGSSVILPNGAIIGVVSAALSRSGPLQTYDAEGNMAKAVHIAGRYFVFTPINVRNARFITATLKSENFSAVLPRIQSFNLDLAPQTSAKLQDVFQEFSSAEDINAAEMKK